MQDETAELKARLAEKDTKIEALQAANEALLARVERLEGLMRR